MASHGVGMLGTKLSNTALEKAKTVVNPASDLGEAFHFASDAYLSPALQPFSLLDLIKTLQATAFGLLSQPWVR